MHSSFLGSAGDGKSQQCGWKGFVREQYNWQKGFDGHWKSEQYNWQKGFMEGKAKDKSFGYGPKGCGKRGRSADEGKGHKCSTQQERTVNLSKTELCYFFQRGNCTKGSACSYAH